MSIDGMGSDEFGVGDIEWRLRRRALTYERANASANDV